MPDDRLVEVAHKIVDQLAQQTRNGIQPQQGKPVGFLFEITDQLELQPQRQQQQQQKKEEKEEQQPASTTPHAEKEQHDEDEALIFME